MKEGNELEDKIITSVMVILIILILLAAAATQAQTINVVNKYYSITYDTLIHAPIKCKYKIFKAGGKVERSQFKFNEYSNSAHKWQFAALGLDRGHLCPYEDCANDWEGARQTMSMYNVLPMTVALNRGTWKKLELKIRKLSQTDTITVECGGLDYIELKNRLFVPKMCYKTYFCHKTKLKKYFIFYNQVKAYCMEVDSVQFNCFVNMKK